MLFEDEPDRECWHEAGHAVVAHHFGMTVIAIGFSWVNGENSEPYPSSWIQTDGFDKESVAIEFLAGSAAEILKLGDYDVGAHRSDIIAWRQLGCSSTIEHYIKEAIEVLKQRDDSLVRVQNGLMQERTNASRAPFVDSGDKMKKQVHLTREEFESLL